METPISPNFRDNIDNYGVQNLSPLNSPHCLLIVADFLSITGGIPEIPFVFRTERFKTPFFSCTAPCFTSGDVASNEWLFFVPCTVVLQLIAKTF